MLKHMRYAFYDSPEYREKQAHITKNNTEKGLYAHLKKQERRVCARTGCDASFIVSPSDPKRYCSQRCATIANNSGRILPESVRRKIAQAALNKPNSFKGVMKVPRATSICANPKCGKAFTHERYMVRKYCSVHCNITVTGSKATSPKASRGKAGIRKDISDTIYFYSRWEANVARLYSHLKIGWEYAPRSFDIGGHTYTPDFYLPELDTYIEVKNFWGSIRAYEMKDSEQRILKFVSK